VQSNKEAWAMEFTNDDILGCESEALKMKKQAIEKRLLSKKSKDNS
jgi:hypothetical protein